VVLTLRRENHISVAENRTAISWFSSPYPYSIVVSQNGSGMLGLSIKFLQEDCEGMSYLYTPAYAFSDSCSQSINHE
jgi:hypothetical protein